MMENKTFRCFSSTCRDCDLRPHFQRLSLLCCCRIHFHSGEPALRKTGQRTGSEIPQTCHSDHGRHFPGLRTAGVHHCRQPHHQQPKEGQHCHDYHNCGHYHDCRRNDHHNDESNYHNNDDYDRSYHNSSRNHNGCDRAAHRSTNRPACSGTGRNSGRAAGGKYTQLCHQYQHWKISLSQLFQCEKNFRRKPQRIYRNTR